MVDWPVTFRCNNNCISCINNTRLFSHRSDPPLKQIRFVIDTIDPKKDYLGLSGGEPTLRKELFDILTYARKRHPDLYIFLVSNGRMFSYRDYAKKLADLKLGNFMVGITLYGHNAELHDSITLTRGSFGQTVDGIRNLLDLGICVEVRAVINRLNYCHLERIASFVAGKFPSVKRMVFINMKMTGNAYINRDKVAIRVSDVVPFAEKAVKILQKRTEVRLYHFPLCILPKKLRPLAEGVTKHDPRELTFVDACRECGAKNKCPKIWSTYVGVMDDSEFHSIGKNKKQQN